MFQDSIVSLRTPNRCVRLPWRQGTPLTDQDRSERISRARQIYDAFYGVGYMMARRSLERERAEIAAAKSPRRY